MANTSDTLGIQTTLDKLIAHELTSFEDDSVTKLRDYAFYYNDVIASIKLPNCASIGSSAFAYCTTLMTVDLSQQISIASGWFSGCSAFTHLILRSTTLCPLGSAFSAVFSGTKIGVGEGAIYVPSNLVDTYKSATNWSAASGQIYALEDYPVTDFSTIKDDWDTIITKLGNGTANYVVGDTKTMNYDGTPVFMQLVALDADDLADNSGKAKSTWISKPILEMRAMNSQQKTVDGTTSWTVGGWANTDLRAYLSSDVMNKLPANIRSAIKEVNKTYRVKSPTDTTLTAVDKLWIPSYKEVGFTNASYVESDGVAYSGVFSSNANRVKYRLDNGSASLWWLRSAYNADGFSCVYNSGDELYNYAFYESGLVIGFCI